MTIPDRNALVESHIELVDKIAGNLIRLFPPSIEYQDLWQEGSLGLMRATETFDPARGTTFRAYAKKRVRGAILDANRRRHFQNATHSPLEEAPEGSASPSHDEEIDAGRLTKKINNVIEFLQPRERGVMQRYYQAGQASNEIAQDTGMLAQRVGKIRRAGVLSMKRGLAMHGILKAA